MIFGLLKRSMAAGGSMKRSFVILTVFILCAAVPSWGDLSEDNYVREASWKEQTRGMLYLILHLSGINAVNGLNFSPEQLQGLRRMALEMEAYCEKVPDFNAVYRPDLAEVRDTYLKVRTYIISNKSVPENLEKQVVRARGIESAVIRLSLSNRNLTRTGCLSCHIEPRVKDIRFDKESISPLNKASCPDFSGRKRETILAHVQSILGNRGIVKLIALAKEVDQLLTRRQKEVLKTFTCCLIPPKDLSDPVRIGQAAGGKKEIEILRKVREVPKILWPPAKIKALKKFEQLLLLKYPGITEAKIQMVRRQVGEIYEKARNLSDVDFEMEKGELAAQLHDAGSLQEELGKRQQDYLNAFFLLIPGSAEVYDNVIARGKK